MSVYSFALRTLRRRLQTDVADGLSPAFPLLPLVSVLVATVVLVTALVWSSTMQDQATAEFVKDAVRIAEARSGILRLNEVASGGEDTSPVRAGHSGAALRDAMIEMLSHASPDIQVKVDAALRASDESTQPAPHYRFANGLAILAAEVDQTMQAQQRRIARSAQIKLLLSLLGGLVIIVSWLNVARTLTEWRQQTAQNEARIRFLAHFDTLTGLPNRLQFRERVEQSLAVARREGQPLAVLCLDLDHFKEINDTLGHPAGDELLQRVAERLKACVRETDTVARFGGDEFVIVQMPTASSESAAVLAKRLIDIVAEPFVIDGTEVVTSLSIGIALAPADGDAADLLLKCADTALFRVKATRRGGFCFFEEEMNIRLQQRRTMEQDLRRALAEGQFTLHYQPQVELSSGRVRGVEALVRWQHPRCGWIAPLQFVPLAEETGLIAPLGEWILRTACQQAAAWPGLRMAVNLSAAQFRMPGLDRIVADALADSGLPPARLELEITESVLLHDTEAALATLKAIKAMGVRIAMDDFGTGYSSLSYLRRFPFDKIKIDGSFVRDVTSEDDAGAIIRAVVHLGHSLGMTTNAEGVETSEQADFLLSQGCDEVQGYHFGRPMPADDLERTLEIAA